MHSLRDESDTLRKNVDDLLNRLTERSDFILDTLQPELMKDYKSLKRNISE